jgi:hypothetical protein
MINRAFVPVIAVLCLSGCAATLPITSMFDTNGNVLTPTSAFHANVLKGTNINTTTNAAGKLTISAETDTNVVNALISAAVVPDIAGVYSFSTNNFTVGNVTNVSIRNGSIRSNHIDTPTWDLLRFDPGYAGTYSNVIFNVSANIHSNFVIGFEAGKYISAAAPHEYSTIIGYNAGTYGTNSSRPTLIGYETGMHSTDATVAVMLGTAAGAHATYAWGSTLLGYAAGRYGASCARTVMVGLDAGRHATNCWDSVIVGAYAGTMAAKSTNDVYIGYFAGATNNGPGNTMIGSESGWGSTNDAEVVYVGYRAGSGAGTITNSVAVGPRAKATASNQVVIGNTNTTSTKLFGIVDAGGITTNLPIGGLTFYITNGIVKRIQ